MIHTCDHCKRHIGYHLDSDAYCRCGHYNIIRNGKLVKLTLKSLYRKPDTLVRNESP